MRDGLSASDVALLSGRTGNNGDGMFGDNGAWWVIIFLIFAFMGWGNRGNGFGGYSSGLRNRTATSISGVQIPPLPPN